MSTAFSPKPWMDKETWLYYAKNEAYSTLTRGMSDEEYNSLTDKQLDELWRRADRIAKQRYKEEKA